MATRSGSVDPGLLLWLQEQAGLTPQQMADALEHESGLVGLAGTPDMRELASRDDPDARLAFDVYVHRLRAGIGAMAAALGGLDALVFTGGVGEGSARVRQVGCEGLSHLGVGIDGRRNEAVQGDADITAETSRVAVLVVRAREDIEIARQARTVVG
jgi:acetate kinase